MTLGEWKIGISFNPSQDANVEEIKGMAAEMIDRLAEIRAGLTEKLDNGHLSAEINRLIALAMTDIESAAMWAVKAATKKAM